MIASDDSAVRKGHDLLRRSFDQAELVTRDDWRDSLRERQARVWADIAWHLVVAEHRGRVVGVASGTYLGNMNTGVIGYLAVSPAARGYGLGPRLRERLHALFRRDARWILHAPLLAVVGEVRRDNPWLRILARRERVLTLDFEYLQPRLYPGAPAVPLVFYYESLDRVRRRLSTTYLRQLLFTIWRRVYRIPRPLGSSMFRRMLRQLAGRRFVGRLTPDAALVRVGSFT